MAAHPPAGKKSFQVELWGEIQVVYDRYEEGRKTLSELIRFFGDRVDADASYAKDISKIVTKAYSVTERGSVGDLWTASKRNHEALSKLCADFGSQLKRDLVSPLEVLKKNQGQQKDALEKKVDKVTKDLGKAKENWQKGKQKFYSCKKSAEIALATYDKAQSDPTMQTTKLSKLNTAQQQAKKEAEVAEAAYRLSIKEFNQMQTKFEEEMVKILAEFQEMEQKRIETVQDAMQKLNMVLVTYATGLEQNRLTLLKAIDSVNPTADVQLFIEDHKSGQTPPGPVEFEPYVDMAPAVPNKPNQPAAAAAAAPSSRPKSENMGLKKDQISQMGKSDEIKKKEEEDAKKKKAEEEERRRKDEEEKRKKQQQEEEDKKKQQQQKAADASPATQSKKDRKKDEKKDDGKKEDKKEKKDKKEEGEKKPAAVASTSSSTAVAAAAPAPTPRTEPPKNAEPVKKAKAVFDYKAADNTEISFNQGDIITVTHVDAESGWWDGTVNGQTGMFPGNYVELVKEETETKKPDATPAAAAPAAAPAATPGGGAAAASNAAPAGFVVGPGEKKVKILYNFEGSGDDELKVSEGDVIIIEEEIKGWYVGRNANGQSGMFPANYAEDLKS